jgi:nucleoside-diphosphate-sugar epimerase
VVYQILTPLLKGKKVRIHGDGRQRRDFLYVDDCAEAFQHALERPAQGCEVVNVGSGRAWSLLELVEEMERVTGLTAQRVHDSAETHVTRVVWVQISRARRRLGWRPRTSLSEGLRTTASWIRSHGLRGETKR